MIPAMIGDLQERVPMDCSVALPMPLSIRWLKAILESLRMHG